MWRSGACDLYHTGHVAIVKSAPSGGLVRFVQQNAYPAVSSKTYTNGRIDDSNIVGWLHWPGPPTPTCPAPSLTEPGDGATVNNHTITFRWNALSGCTFNGYTFRVKTESSMDCCQPAIIDTGVSGTDHTATISSHENEDLYWGVRAANAPSGASWAVRRFRIGPIPSCNPGTNEVALFVDSGYSGQCVVKGIGQYPNPGAIGLPNDSISSIRVGSNVKAILCRDDNYQSTCETFTSDDDNLAGNSVGNDSVSSLKVESRQASCTTPSAISPNDDRFPQGQSISFSWSGDCSQYYAEYWGGPAGTAGSGWQSGTSWYPGSVWCGNYCWHVKGKSSSGQETGWSSELRFTVVPKTPTSLSATAISRSQINLSWNDPGGEKDGYKVYRAGNYLGQTSSTSYEVTSLDCSVRYCFYVKAYKGDLVSDQSNEACATTQDCPPQQADLRPESVQEGTAPVIVSSIKNTHVVNALFAGKPTYFDWRFTNSGGAGTGSFYVDLWIDAERRIHYPFSDCAANQSIWFLDWNEGVVTPGVHRVRLVLDPDNTVAESDENNNAWEGQFIWLPVNGWWAEFYNNETLSGDPVLVRDDASIDFDWYGDAPGAGVNADHFSACWTRTVAFGAGTYRFEVYPDDGANLWIDGVQVLDKWNAGCCQWYTVERSLTAGNHDIKLEMHEIGGWAAAKLKWTPVSTPVPNDQRASAHVITALPFTYQQDTTQATTAQDDPALPCVGDQQRYKTVWYRYLPPSNDRVTLDTAGSSYDTVLAVWRDAGGALTQVGCNDDVVGSTQARLVLDLQAGWTYLIEIAAYSDEGGGQLRFSATSAGTAPTLTPVPFTWREEAEHGALTAPMAVGQDQSASDCGFVSSGVRDVGEVRFNIQVPSYGSYYLWARARAQDVNHNSFFWYVDDSAQMWWEMWASGQWVWLRVTTQQTRDDVAEPVTLVLAPGWHSLRFVTRGQEVNTELDCLVLTNDAGYVPDGVLTSCQAITPTRTRTPAATPSLAPGDYEAAITSVDTRCRRFVSCEAPPTLTSVS